MKKTLHILIMILLLFSCSNDDSIQSHEIVGKWKLMKAYSYGPDPITGNYYTETTSYYISNIIYEFNLDGILTISGGDNIGYPNGEYEYTFGEDYLGSTNSGPFVKLVNINGLKWTHEYKKGVMTLGRSYIDGSNLVFVRK